MIQGGSLKVTIFCMPGAGSNLSFNFFIGGTESHWNFPGEMELNKGYA